ncbi:MAG: sodium-dependent bicarbonate transport family permease [Leptospiraceae bacterium]|nr:sodium-dependent bicarbonate transport family permease [Leptospiraceae bacterium]
MEVLNSLTTSMSSPMVLAFILGLIATLLKSDLKFPDGWYLGLTAYLLFAIGMKGGVKLSLVNISDIIKPASIAILICICIPIWSYFILKKIGKFDIANAAGIAAHYGSVSVVTFSEASSRLDLLKVDYEGFMPSLLAIMEIPAIIIALFIARIAKKNDINEEKVPIKKILHELLTGKGTILLVGGILIGIISGKKGYEQVMPLFDAPFKGILTLFLLEVGLVAGRRLGDLKKAGPFLILFGVLMPLIHGTIGIFLGSLVGLSLGGGTLFGVLCASASYIAAPASVRIALPEASPTYYLTASLAITFPFNVTIGLPIYYSIAKAIYGA